MADSEESAATEIANDDDQQEDDSCRRPLLPCVCVSTRPESSSARSSQQQHETEEDVHKLRQLRSTASYIGGAADVFMRASALVFTLVALILTAINRDDYPLRRLSSVTYLRFFVSGYVLSVNVVVCIYSLSVVGFTIFQLINLNVQGSSNLLFLLSIFQLDQTFAYLLMSSSSNALSCMGTLTCGPDFERHAFCARARASATVTLLAFFAMAMASLVSGFRLAAKILGDSHEAQLALCTLVDDGSSCSSSPASKLLP